MAESKDNQETTIDVIKKKVRLLDMIVLIIVFVTLFLIVKFSYDILDYIPLPSVVTILLVVAGLSVTGMYAIKTTTREIIQTVDDYYFKLHTLLNSTKKLHEIVHSDILLNNIMDISLRITNANAGSVMLIENEMLVFKIVKGPMTEKLTGFSIPKTHGIVGWVVGNGVPARVDNAQKDSRFYNEVDKGTGYDTRSILCVPLKIGTKTIGALEVINKERGAFTAEDEQILSYFADQTAVSIERAKFYEDEKNYQIHITNILIEAIENLSEKRGHQKRVAKLTLLMANALNMTDDEKKRLYHASLLHDIGFLKLRLDGISLGSDYRSHSRLGYELLKPINCYADITEFILHHHERFDGTGYPDGLKGNAIPLESRIIFIAEAFDAMVSRDSYKNIGKVIRDEGIIPTIVEFHRAVEELKRNAGTQFDPELVKVFAENITEDILDDNY